MTDSNQTFKPHHPSPTTGVLREGLAYSQDYYLEVKHNDGPVSQGCRIHQLHLCKEVRPPPAKKKQSDDEAPVMLEL